MNLISQLLFGALFIVTSSTSKNLISVIIPVYNTAQYLRQTLDSIIDQSIGFEDNIEVIIVNDGSTDSSDAICSSYQTRFPMNIQYIKQTHSGVSVARNVGLRHARGKYLTFLDSDDYWTSTSFANLVDFFDIHYTETDVICARTQFFENASGFGPYDYRFSAKRIINLLEEPQYYQVEAAETFIKRESIGNITFPERLDIGEDGVFINRILMKKCTIGFVPEATYRIRRRADGSSALNKILSNHNYYFSTPTIYHQGLFQESSAQYGFILPFIQYTIMNEIHYRIEKDICNFLSEEEVREYRFLLTKSLKQIDDVVIIKHPVSTPPVKILCLAQKHNDIISHIFIHDYSFYYHQWPYLNLSTKFSILHITSLICVGQKLSIVGMETVSAIYPGFYLLIVKVNGRIYRSIDNTKRSFITHTVFGDKQWQNCIQWSIPLSQTNNLVEFFLLTKNSTIQLTVESILEKNGILSFNLPTDSIKLTDNSIMIITDKSRNSSKSRYIFLGVVLIVILHSLLIKRKHRYSN